MTGPLDTAALEAALGQGRGGILRTTLVADLETPVAAFMKLRRVFSGPAFLLESVEGGATRGRYSMIGVAPDLLWRCEGGKASRGRLGEALTPEALPPLESLRTLVRESALDLERDLAPMSAGLFGYLGYDMVREMERLGAAKPDPIGGVPDAILMRPTLIIVFDNVRDEMSVITPVRPRAGASVRVLVEEASERIDAAVAALEAPLALDEAPPLDLGSIQPGSNTTPEDYMAMVERAKDYVRAGDIFQSSCPSVSRPLSPCQLCRCIAPCGGSIPRPISATSISRRSRSSAPARKSWCGCGTGASPCDP